MRKYNTFIYPDPLIDKGQNWTVFALPTLALFASMSKIDFGAVPIPFIKI